MSQCPETEDRVGELGIGLVEVEGSLKIQWPVKNTLEIALERHEITWHCDKGRASYPNIIGRRFSHILHLTLFAVFPICAIRVAHWDPGLLELNRLAVLGRWSLINVVCFTLGNCIPDGLSGPNKFGDTAGHVSAHLSARCQMQHCTGFYIFLATIKRVKRLRDWQVLV